MNATLRLTLSLLQRGFKRGRIEAIDGKRLVRVKVIGGSGTADREPPWGNGGDIAVTSRNGKYSVNGILSDIPSSGIFRVVGGDLAQSLRFIAENSEY
jgi:hypothetical protein